MSYQEHARDLMREYSYVSERNNDKSLIWVGIATVSMELLGALADELHELNKRLGNGETVQTGPDQTGT